MRNRGDLVRVVSVGDFTIELCVTHVSNSGEIGLFKIISETGVAAGIRRIEAITGFNAIRYVNDKLETIKDVSQNLKCSPKEVINRSQSIIQELKDKDREINELKKELAKGAEGELLNNIKEVKGVKYIAAAVENMDSENLRELGDRLRSRLDSGLVV